MKSTFFRNILTAAVFGGLSVALLASTPAFAQEVASTTGPTGTSTLFTFTPNGAIDSGSVAGTEGWVDVNGGGSYEFTGSLSTGLGSFAQYSGANGTGSLLVSGTFSNLFEEPVPPEATTLMLSESVDYTGGSEVTPYYPNGATGSFGLSLSVNSPYEATSNNNAYEYSNTYTIVTTPVSSTPEPNPAIAIGIASAVLMGLLIVGKRRTSSFNASAV